MYRITEIDGTDSDDAHTIRRFNAMVPDWPIIEPRHLQMGYWWTITDTNDSQVGFSGMVPFEPFQNVGYLKRCYVLPEHRGNGLQMRTMLTREAKAKKLGWLQLVSECTSVQSAGNFIKAGYSPCDPEQKWGAEGSMYFTKTL